MSKVVRPTASPPACPPACPPDQLSTFLPAQPPAQRVPVLSLAGVGTPGNLGDGLSATSATPVLVSGSYSFSKVFTSSSIDPTKLHACGLLTTQSIVCWGSGGYGQLGNGATSDSSTPVLVSGGSFFTDLAVGGIHTCAVDTTNAAFCWGELCI